MIDGQRARRSLAAIVAATAIAVLIGWALDIAVLKHVLPGLTTMKANTALCLLLAAGSVAVADAPHRAWRIGAVVAATLLAMIGLLTLVEYWFGLSFGLDEMFFADPDTTSAPFNGRMSPATAFALVGTGASLVLVTLGRTHRSVVSGHVLAIAPAAVGVLSLTGYAYNVQALYRLGPFVTVALHTGVGLTLLAAAILFTRPAEGWFAPFRGHPIATSVLFRVGALGLILPFVMGLLVVRGIRAGYYEAQVTPALFAVAATGLLVWLALRSASILAVAEGRITDARQDARDHALALERSDLRHRALVERVPQLVWTCLPDGRCDYLSPQWIGYTGVALSDQLGFDWLQVIHPDDAERTRDHWMGAVAGLHPYDIDYRIRGTAGGYRWFKTRGTPIRDAAGEIEYWFGTCTDIQESVEARDVLARSQIDLERQVEARTTKLMEVEAQLRQSQKMEALGQLTGGVAHDFNNLLTIIRSAAELLGRPHIPDLRRRAYLDAIVDTADRAARLTTQLLAFSRRQALKPEVFDAAEKIEGVLDMLRSIVGSRIRIDVDFACAPCFLLADISQFEMAVVNMAVNARDAMAGEGTLTVRVEVVDHLPGTRDGAAASGRFVALSLADTGSGIPEPLIDKVFEPFFTTKAVGKGTGLGLSQVFGFAKQSGGDVSVQSAEGRGTSFTLYLPHADDPGVREPDGERAAEISAPRDGTARHVLVVEDNVDVGRFSTQLLQDLGYRTTWAHDARQALILLKTEGRFDVVFSDVVMPGMSGVELGHEIRRLYPRIPVVLTSGYSDVLADEGRHGFDLLKKPYRPDELSGFLERAVAA